MMLKTCEFISILLAALVSGMFLGPWAALTRSMDTFPPEVFLPLVKRMNRNMAQIMTPLMPAALLAILPVLYLSYAMQPRTFYLTLAAFVLLLIALLVTMAVEVPIVRQISTWNLATMPDNWQQLRDRWGAFHLIRILAGLGALVLLAFAAIFLPG